MLVLEYLNSVNKKIYLIMELQLVSFEQAKALKEVGFPQNIYTSQVYLEKTIPHDIIAKECGLSDWQCIGGTVISCSSSYNKYGVDTCRCPTLELVAKWLRDKKNLWIKISKGGYDKSAHCFLGDYIYEDATHIKEFATYEDALSAGIDKAIEILKTN